MAWYECHVKEAGPKGEDQKVYIALKDKGNKFDHWFVAGKSQQKELLATALAAVTSGHSVSVGLGDTAAYATVDTIYLQDHK